MSIRLATAAQNASAKAVGDLVDADAGAGTLKIYSGAQPATGDTEGTGLLATVAFSVTAFGAPASGTISATDPASVDPTGTGDAASFVVEDATGDNVFNGTVTATGGGGDLELSNVSLAPGINVDITSFTYTQPAG